MKKVKEFDYFIKILQVFMHKTELSLKFYKKFYENVRVPNIKYENGLEFYYLVTKYCKFCCTKLCFN